MFNSFSRFTNVSSGMIYDLIEKFFWEFLELRCLLWYHSVGRAKLILKQKDKLQLMVDNPFRKLRQSS